MATHRRMFTGLSFAADVEDGIPLFRGFRQELRLQSQFDVFADDDIGVEAAVPPGEYWQLRVLSVIDLTGGGAWGAQSWDTLALDYELPRYDSEIAAAATSFSSGAFARNGVTWSPVWEHGWDGVTHVTWEDVNRVPLLLTASDPTFDVHLLPPSSRFRIRCEGATVAGGGFERAFTVRMLVERFLDPLDALTARLRDDRGIPVQDWHLSAHGLLVRP